MRIGLVVVTYSMVPAKLFASIPTVGYDLRWHVLHHGPDASLARRIERAVKKRGGNFVNFFANRGLARSWNDGILWCLKDDCDVVILLNDDLFFYENGFKEFTTFVEKQMVLDQDLGIVTVMGRESGPGIHFEHVIKQDFACAVLMPRCLKEIGAFDENFRVAYCEDIDYMLRLGAVGLTMVCDERVLVEHERGSTMRSDPALGAYVRREGEANHDYFVRKWGGPIYQQAYRDPFNDSEVGFAIPFERRARPYGPGRDRDDPVSTMVPSSGAKPRARLLRWLSIGTVKA